MQCGVTFAHLRRIKDLKKLYEEQGRHTHKNTRTKNEQMHDFVAASDDHDAERHE